MLCASLLLGSQSALGLVATGPISPAVPVVGRAAASPSMVLGIGGKIKDLSKMALTGKVVPTNTGLAKPATVSGMDETGRVTLRVGGETIVVKKSADFVNSLSPLTEKEVLECQANWAGAIAACSEIYAAGGDYVGAAAGAASDLYGYGFSQVLFKPTKAAEYPFRPTAEEAMSYFVGGDVINGGYDEDAGFAINGGKGWSNVEFHNHAIDINGLTATAMGYYIFTCATTGDKVRVEYTFGYKRCSDGKPRIYLHHSSVPYSAAPAVTNPLTEAEVLECQKNWANAIASISKVYLEKGDFVAAAGEAAGELYGYGHGNVLFKPTKATKHPFRPTGEDAMSYFVGSEAMGNDKFTGEDAGFAINGGRGWSNVVFTNHDIKILGEQAIAMGSYDFTAADDGSVATVEYTFGYKRCADGKPRIFLHHSSVPYSP